MRTDDMNGARGGRGGAFGQIVGFPSRRQSGYAGDAAALGATKEDPWMALVADVERSYGPIDVPGNIGASRAGQPA